VRTRLPPGHPSRRKWEYTPRDIARAAGLAPSTGSRKVREDIRSGALRDASDLSAVLEYCGAARPAPPEPPPEPPPPRPPEPVRWKVKGYGEVWE
jgi:hypothetical protein